MMATEVLPRTNRSPFYFVPVMFALLVPKITLLQISDVAVRPDDILIMVGAVMAMTTYPGLRRMGKMDRAVLGWVAIMLWTAVLGASRGSVALIPGLAFAVRPAEYWLIVRLMLAARPSRELFDRVLSAMIIVNAGIAALQVAGILDSFSRFDASRGSALFSGPYELAAVASGCLLYFLERRRPLSAGAAVVALVCSAARITVVGVLIAAAIRSSSDGRGDVVRGTIRRMATLWVIAVFVTATMFGIGPLHGLRNRLSIGVAGAVSYGISLSERAPSPLTREGYIKFAYHDRPYLLAPKSLDPSSVIRFTRWAALIRGTTSRIQSTIFGLGPSFAGVAVDGQLIRTFIESGIVGLIGLLLLFRAIARLDAQYIRQYVFALMITSLFIDVMVSFKPMVLLWAFCGLERSSSAGEETHFERAGVPSG